MKKIFFIAFCFMCVLSKSAEANELSALQSQVSELAKTVQGLQLVIESQQREIQLLKAVAPSNDGAVRPPAPVSVSGPGRSLQGRWNPDIGFVADMIAKLDSPKEDAEGADRVSVREAELVLGSAVDPYSRLDATISFSDFEEASLEEAYYTHFGLPFDLTARVGRFKPAIGKALAVHRDSLDTIDEPLVIQRYFGLEGYNKSGADIKKPLELPWAWTHQVSLGVLEGGNGEGGTLFGDTRRQPTLYSHLKNYLDISDAMGLELGLSGLTGSRDEDATFEVGVLGLDGTLIHRFADQRHWKLQGESFYVNSHLWGSYLLADFRFHSQWATGLRFDHVELVDDDAANSRSMDVGYTGYLTFYQSEFARWRAQFTHLDLTSGQEDNQILLQGTFAIGEHKHKLQ